MDFFLVLGVLFFVVGVLLVFLCRYLLNHGDTKRIMNGRKDRQMDDLTN